MLKPIKSLMQLRTAMFDKRNVYVYLDDELSGEGIIEDITYVTEDINDEIVKIAGEYFVRSKCTFYS